MITSRNNSWPRVGCNFGFYSCDVAQARCVPRKGLRFNRPSGGFDSSFLLVALNLMIFIAFFFTKFQKTRKKYFGEISFSNLFSHARNCVKCFTFTSFQKYSKLIFFFSTCKSHKFLLSFSCNYKIQNFQLLYIILIYSH